LLGQLIKHEAHSVRGFVHLSNKGCNRIYTCVSAIGGLDCPGHFWALRQLGHTLLVTQNVLLVLVSLPLQPLPNIRLPHRVWHCTHDSITQRRAGSVERLVDPKQSTFKG
jgi:hypothetical protein